MVRVTTVVVLAAVSLAVAWLAHSPALSSMASTSSYLSVDVSTDGNERNAIGAIDSCTDVNTGEEFTVDVVVRDVTDVVAWEFRLEFDGDIVSLNSVDYDHFLVSNDPGINISPKLMDIESPDRVFLGAGEVRGNPDSGSGVLARLTMGAISSGVSQLRIISQPVYRGPRLTDALGAPVGDSNGDGLWDNGITNAQVAVDGSCDELDPIPTPPPAPSPTPGDGSTDGTGGSSSGSITGNGSVAVIDSDPSGVGDGTDPGTGSDSDGPDGNSSGSDGTSETEGEGTDPGTSSPGSNSANDDGLGDIPLVIGGIALAAIAMGAGTLFIFRRRGTW